MKAPDWSCICLKVSLVNDDVLKVSRELVRLSSTSLLTALGGDGGRQQEVGGRDGEGEV